MKTITLKNKDKEIELEQRIEKCSFCGEDKKECVKGSVPFEVEIDKDEVKMVKVMTNPTLEKVPEEKSTKYCVNFWPFQKDYYQFTDYKFKWVTDDYDYKYIINSMTKEKITDDADICLDCIRNLAKLIK